MVRPCLSWERVRGLRASLPGLLHIRYVYLWFLTCAGKQPNSGLITLAAVDIIDRLRRDPSVTLLIS
eukprot:SAG11_NODE_1838_length_4187_cov_3.622554_3_plen_67_part_00